MSVAGHGQWAVPHSRRREHGPPHRRGHRAHQAGPLEAWSSIYRGDPAEEGRCSATPGDQTAGQSGKDLMIPLASNASIFRLHETGCQLALGLIGETLRVMNLLGIEPEPSSLSSQRWAL